MKKFEAKIAEKHVSLLPSNEKKICVNFMMFPEISRFFRLTPSQVLWGNPSLY